jgi:hypothetical protein
MLAPAATRCTSSFLYFQKEVLGFYPGGKSHVQIIGSDGSLEQPSLSQREASLEFVLLLSFAYRQTLEGKAARCRSTQ